MNILSTFEKAADSGRKIGTDQRLANRRRDFPVWHFPMVNDLARNAAIENAIKALDLAGKTVVEIGTGTGLIALLFAKHGAARVISCEMNANLAAIAARIVGATEHADRIHIINESSTSAIKRGLLPQEPDVIFTETIDCGVVGEGFFAVAEDIERIAGPQTNVLPPVITQTAALIQSEDIAHLNRAGTSCGFDLSLLNEFSTLTYFPVRSELFNHVFLSEPVAYRNFRYINCPASEVIRVKARRRGIVHGILSWFDADFGGAAVSNAPRTGSHWHQAFHPLAEDLAVDEGETISLLIDDEGYAWAVRDR